MWQQLIVNTTFTQSELISDWLFANDALSVSVNDRQQTIEDDYSLNEIPISQEVKLTALFYNDIDLTHVREGLKQHWSIDTLEIAELADQNWIKASQDLFKPQHFKKMSIYPSWELTSSPKSNDLVLDPGMAFGTGMHPTTSMLLHWINQTDMTGKKILDYGCGSGILALAALKCGADKVVATDIDSLALQATKENAQRNNLLEQITLVEPDDLKPQTFDVILANILARPLIELSQPILSLLAPHGSLALSGVLVEQAEEVMKAYQAQCTFQAPIVSDQWCALIGIRDNII